jgi:hypothetical protein
VIVLVFLANGSGSTGSEKRVELENPTQKLKLPIVNFIFWFSSTYELLLAKSEKAIKSIIPTPQLPTVGAN